MKGVVVFNLESALLCTHQHICQVAHKTLNESNRPDVDDKEIIRLIGEIELFEGVIELLSNLKREGFHLALCSSGSQEYIALVLKTTGIECMFQYTISSPKFESKDEAVHEFLNSISCDNFIMVGDRHHNLTAAQSTRIPTIVALYGYGDVDETSTSLFTAKTPGDIYPLVMQITLYTQIYTQIKQASGVRCVGINGVDTSGKSIFANQFSEVLRSKGEDVAIVHLDDFHNPKALRVKGNNEITAYITNAFDLSTLLNEILCPLRYNGEVHKELTLLDLDSDLFTLKRQYDISVETIVVLEGVLLYREPLEDFIDFKIFLDISFDEVIRRAIIRDVPKYGTQFLDKYREKYIPIQQWYLESCDPKGKSNIVVDNSNPNQPLFLEN